MMLYYGQALGSEDCGLNKFFSMGEVEIKFQGFLGNYSKSFISYLFTIMSNEMLYKLHSQA